MTVARIVCVVSLRLEVFSLGDGPDARLAEDAERLYRSRQLTEALLTPGAEGNLATLAAIDAPTNKRPTFTVLNIQAKSFSWTVNSFRKADELDVTVPLSAIPVPLAAIRNMTCEAVIRHVSDEDWGNGVLPTTAVADKDFYGVGKEPSQSVASDGVATMKCTFVDYVGLLSGKKVEAGKEFEEDYPVSKMVEQFLKASWAEGMTVRWVDPQPEPTLGGLAPVLHKKKKGKKASRPVPSSDNYLDAITKACHELGVVPRVNGDKLDLSYAGTMYQGQNETKEVKSFILLGQNVHSIKAKHDLIGSKLESVRVVSFDPIRRDQFAARWPPDPKQKTAVTAEQGKRPEIAPILAHLGRPGYEQLDDTVLSVPIGPVANPELLPKIAEAIFFERSRQRTHIDITTYSPFSGPTDDPDVLRLRAGDDVWFGFLDDALLAPECRAINGNLGQGVVKQLLERNGVPSKTASQIAEVVALVPKTDRLRVDEMKVSGGEKSDPVIELRLVTYTVITSDLQAKADGRTPDDVLAQLVDGVVGETLDQIRERIKKARMDLDASDASPEAKKAAGKKIDQLAKQLLKGAK